MFTLARRIPSTANLWGSRPPPTRLDDEAAAADVTTDDDTTTRGTPTPALSSPSPQPVTDPAAQDSWRVDVDLDTAAHIIRAVATGVIRGLSPLEVAHIIRAPEAAPVFRIESRVPLEARDAPPDAAPLPSESTHARASEAALPRPADEKEYHEEIVFLAPMRVLFWKVWTRAKVRQTWRAADPRRVTSDFSLVTADLMAALKGKWVLEEEEDGFDGGEEEGRRGGDCGDEGATDAAAADDDGARSTTSSSSFVSAAEEDEDDEDETTSRRPPSSSPNSSSSTRLTYTFEMWPKGVPTALRHVPSIMDAVRESVARQVAQTLDKVAYVAGKVGGSGGEEEEEEEAPKAAAAPSPPPPPAVRAWVFSSRSPSPSLAAAPVPTSSKSPFATAATTAPSPSSPSPRPRSAASSPSAAPLCVVAAVREVAAEVQRAGSFKKLAGGIEAAGPVTASLTANRRASSAAAGGVPAVVLEAGAVARTQSAGKPPLPRRPASASFPSAAARTRQN